MKRRTHARSGPTDWQTSRRQRLGTRLFTLGALATVAVIVLTSCGASPNDEKPYSTTSPASPNADDIQDLYKLVFWLALVVFVGVQFAIVYTALRFRRSRSTGPRPPQIHGNKRLEIIWTIIPAVVLLVVLIPTITTMYDHDAAAEEGDIVIDVYGKQWWWEMHYRTDNAQGGESLNVVTANELHLPEGKEAIIRLHSNNVIHSFWVPRLSGKVDVVPGHVNRLSITPTESGEYFGECAEFCGTQHAWMRFKIVVQPEAEFYSWVNSWRTGNPGNLDVEAADAADVTRVPAAFAVCLSCHTVNGVGDPGLAGIDAPARFGPNLTNIACRETIAAGLLENNPENMAQWIDDPESVKPGNNMSSQITPGFIRASFPDGGFEDLMTYLATLQPEAGCASIGAANHLGEDNTGTPGATPLASPEASPVATPAAWRKPLA